MREVAMKVIVLFCVLNSIIDVSRAQLERIILNKQELDIETKYKVLNQFKNIHESFIVNPRADFTISPECLTSLALYGKGLIPTTENLKEWALKMFDATGKFESGILEGNFFSLGSYDECLSIRNEYDTIHDDKNNVTTIIPIKGQYCLGILNIFPEDATRSAGVLVKDAYFWGSCTPAACTPLELMVIMLPFKIVYSEELCQVYEEEVELSGGAIATISFLSIITAIVVISTIYDYYLERTEKSRKSMESQVLLSFSLLTNGRKLFSTNSAPDQLECLSGLRTISMMWIVLGHEFNSFTTTPVSNLQYVYDFMADGWSMYLRGAGVSVDTFFLMSGIVLIYVYKKSTRNTEGNFNIFYYYLHRYIRLTPALAVLILVHVTLVKYMGAGPLRPALDAGLVDVCDKYWWSTLLYIQNFVNFNELCIGQTWYLSVDFQLFLISPFILIPLKRWPRATLAGVGLLAAGTIVSAFVTAWELEMRDSNFFTNVTLEQSEDFMYYFYYAPYNRASPWLIGILMGYLIYYVKFEQKIEITTSKSKLIANVVNLMLWGIALALLLTCVFYDHKQVYDRLAISTWIALQRPVWAIGLSWIVFSCVMGYGGPINAFLSMPLFQILGRLTYSMYLLHTTINILVYSSSKSSMVLSNVLMLYNFWSLFMLCLGCSIVWTLLFESPIIMLEKAFRTKQK